jgi:hypothetical protein
MLVPEGSPWGIADDRGRSAARATVVLTDGEFCDGEIVAQAATPAIALCIAALRARATAPAPDSPGSGPNTAERGDG